MKGECNRMEEQLGQTPSIPKYPNKLYNKALQKGWLSVADNPFKE